MVLTSFIKIVKLFAREYRDLRALLQARNKSMRTLTFYAEGALFYQYYESVIEVILQMSSLDICYITSDPHDPIFHHPNKHVHAFYIDRLLVAALSRLDSTVLVMTMTDLETYNVKRSQNVAEYVYLFHAMISTHLVYREVAFDYYDTIFCVGPHHVQEIRKAETMRALPQKNLLEIGYPRLEKIYRDHRAFIQKRSHKERSFQKTILIAPTWGPHVILTTCIAELIALLAETEYRVLIRPHPEFIKRNGSAIKKIIALTQTTLNIQLEQNLLSDASLHEADVLITDHSGIAFEYAFGTERPVLFIDTPLKIRNPVYQRLSIEPMEITLRNIVGVSVSPRDIVRLPSMLHNLLNQQEQFAERIRNHREKYVFHWMNAARGAAQALMTRCRQG